MACSMLATVAIFASVVSVSFADEIAWGDVAADGSLNQRSLDVPVAMARGAENFFVGNPMDSYDWAHTSVVRNSMLAEVKAANGNAAKVTTLQEQLKPIFTAMPKNSDGRLNNGTARYALHRFFSEKHGWAIKGLQPAGAAWMATLSVTPDVKDITKYMAPTYLQDQLLAQLGMADFDLRSLAILAATIEHLIQAEMKSIVYSAITTLDLPIPGKKSEEEVNQILDTFMMVYAFGMNLDASSLVDAQRAKAHLERSHSGWPQLQAFAQEVKKNTFATGELNFDEIVQVVMKIGEGYVQWQGKDCARVKEELVAKPSHREGRVLLSEVAPSHTPGRRSLFTESVEDLEKLGVLSTGSDTSAQLIIPNYVNSQSMCLSTSSFYTACCVNECEGLLAKLERQVAGPAAGAAELARLIAGLPGPGISEALIKELHGLVDQSSGLVPLHGRALAEWMNRAFPFECPAPHSQKVTNPKTPDEWMERDDAVADLEEMMGEIAQVLSRYTTMGKTAGKEVFTADDEYSDTNTDVVRVHPPIVQNFQQSWSLWHAIATMFRFAAMISMMGLVVVIGKSGLMATGARKDKVGLKDFGQYGYSVKDFV